MERSERLRGHRRRRRLHRDQRARRRERDAPRGGAAVCGDWRRSGPLDREAPRQNGWRADRRGRSGDRHRRPQSGSPFAAGAGIRRFRFAPSRTGGAGVRQSPRPGLVGDDGRCERGGAATDARGPDDLHPDRCADQSWKQRRRSRRHGRAAGRDQHADLLAVGR